MGMDTNELLRSHKLSDDAWVSKINVLIGTQRTTVFEIGDALLAAKAETPKVRFQTIIKSSGLKSKKTAENYMRVARNDYLRKPKIMDKLPTNVGALIDLAAWSDGAIDLGIFKNIIHPQAERKELRTFLKRLLSPERMELPETARVVGYIMCDIAAYDSKRHSEFIERFDEIRLKCLGDDMYISPEKDFLEADPKLS